MKESEHEITLQLTKSFLQQTFEGTFAYFRSLEGRNIQSS